MLCYKDMTFCPFYKECTDEKDCHRRLTPEVIEAAEKWMKNAPIAQFMDKPEWCFIEKGANEK